MTLDFDRMPSLVQPRFKGGQGEAETRIFQDGMGKILRLTLTPVREDRARHSAAFSSFMANLTKTGKKACYITAFLIISTLPGNVKGGRARRRTTVCSHISI